MPRSNMEVQSLDLAARTIDLTTALLKATASTGSLVKGALEIGQWLGREKLNQHELLDFMEKSKGLAFANKNGQDIFDDIIYGLYARDVRKAWPLFLQQSGSLGRLMAGDPNLSWVVSTVACLFQFYSEDLVENALMAFILESNRSRERRIPSVHDTAPGPADHIRYYNMASDHQRTRMGAIVRKIVSSIWFNVVNAGCNTISLPQELLSICSGRHFLKSEDFGTVVDTILTRCPSKAIFKMKHLIQDVVLWLLLHYDGKIVITVGSHIIYKTSLGNDDHELQVRVDSACSEDGSCPEDISYGIYNNITGDFKGFPKGYSVMYSSYEGPKIRRNSTKFPGGTPTIVRYGEEKLK